LSAVFVFVLVLAMYTEVSYSVSMPNTPDPTTGRVHRLVVNHGAVIFVNADELRYKRRTEHTMILGICLLGSSAT
jgi:hypothetical protein